MGGSRYASTDKTSKLTGPRRIPNGSYAKFGDEVELPAYPNKRKDDVRTTVEAGSGEDAAWEVDDDSEKGIVQSDGGIMQTRTYTVQHD